MGSNILLLLGDVHAAACGIEIEGLRPFDASQGFFGSLKGLLQKQQPLFRIIRLFCF